MAGLPKTFVKGFHIEETVRKMTYNPLGKTGLVVSKISLGGGTLAPFYGELDEAGAIRTIQSAIRNGINYIDTAPFYGLGKSEKVLGKALKDVPREAYYIATKVGRYDPTKGEGQFDFSAAKTKESFETSLKYLELDYVDVIQIHDVEFAKNLDIVINETLPVLEEFVRQGKAKFIGVTGYPLSVLKEAILKAPGRFHTVLSYARNTLLDDSLRDYIPFFKQQNLGIINAAGHAMGILTNNGPFDWHPGHESTKEQGRKASEYCKKNGIELGKLAMWYYSQLEGPDTFLTGMQTEKLLQINLESVWNGLTPKETEVLEYVLEHFCKEKSNWEGVEHKQIFGY